MSRVRELLAWCRDHRGHLVLVAVVAAIGVVSALSAYRLNGTVYATLIGTDGSMRSVSFSLQAMHELEYLVFQPDGLRSLIAVVPAPQGGNSAFVTRTKGAPPELLIGNTDGVETRVVAVGEVSDPRWSPQGTSIAFATRDDAVEEISPEAWVVVRAVEQGDTLTVGRGYEPHPSPSQRTFALTSRGIALLSYSDAPPSIVVASPVPVPLSTPFAVSQDGTRLAWVAPADRSLQVFEEKDGYFVPLILEKTFIPETMTFSPDGAYLLGTTHTDATTTVSVFTITTGRVRALGEFNGFMRLLTWSNE